MAVAATKTDYAPDSPPALSLKGKEGVIDAMEDIVFGSVRPPKFDLQKSTSPRPSNLLQK